MGPRQFNVRVQVLGVDLDGFLELYDSLGILPFINKTLPFENESRSIVRGRYQDHVSLLTRFRRFVSEQEEFAQLEVGILVCIVQLYCSAEFGECSLKIRCPTQFEICQGQAVMAAGIFRVELRHVLEFQ